MSLMFVKTEIRLELNYYRFMSEKFRLKGTFGRHWLKNMRLCHLNQVLFWPENVLRGFELLYSVAPISSLVLYF